MTKNFSLLFAWLWRRWINNAAASPVSIDATAHMHRFGGSRLDKAWDEATAKGWIVLSMKDDWKTIFPSNGAKEWRFVIGL